MTAQDALLWALAVLVYAVSAYVLVRTIGVAMPVLGWLLLLAATPFVLLGLALRAGWDKLYGWLCREGS